MTEPEPLIRLKDISFAYPSRGKVLDHLNLEIRKGERIGLVGHNGSGKTTLFHIIMGLLRPGGGSIEMFGRPVETEKDFKGIYPKVGLLFQDADDQLFSPTVLEDVAFGPLNLGKTKQQAGDIAEKTLARLGIESFGPRVTHKLSGGEKRLVALATVLAMEPEVLLLDEPSTGLDEKTKEILADLLNRLELTYVLISHELEFMSKICHDILMMKDGKVSTDVWVHTHAHAHPCHGHDQ